MVSLPTFCFVVALGLVQWHHNGVLDPMVEVSFLYLPFMIGHMSVTVFNVLQRIHDPDLGGWKYARYPLGVGLVLVPVFYGLAALMAYFDVDLKYYSRECSGGTFVLGYSSPVCYYSFNICLWFVVSTVQWTWL